MKRVMGLLDKNEEGDGFIRLLLLRENEEGDGIIRWEWRGWWDYMIRMKRVMWLLDKNEEGDGIIR